MSQLTTIFGSNMHIPVSTMLSFSSSANMHIQQFCTGGVCILAQNWTCGYDCKNQSKD